MRPSSEENRPKKRVGKAKRGRIAQVGLSIVHERFSPRKKEKKGDKFRCPHSGKWWKRVGRHLRQRRERQKGTPQVSSFIIKGGEKSSLEVQKARGPIQKKSSRGRHLEFHEEEGPAGESSNNNKRERDSTARMR